MRPPCSPPEPSIWASCPVCRPPRRRSPRSSSGRPAATSSTSRLRSTRGPWCWSARGPRYVRSACRSRSTPSCACWPWTRRRAAWTSRSSSTRTAATAVSSSDSRSSSGVIDLKLLRASPQQVRAALARRGDPTVTRLLDELEALDMRRRALTGQLDQLKAERNEAAKADARLMKEKGALPPDVRESRRALGERIDRLEAEPQGFEEEAYRTAPDDLFLVPTAEVPVTNLHRDEILHGADLPLAYTAYTPCFRREAGAAGRDTRGLLRVHQFDKVELVRFARPPESPAEHERMTGHAEAVLQRLELPYRVVLLAAGDLGFASAKTYDLEVWAPGVGQWLEVSSSSTFTDFQARRANIRYRASSGAKPELAHTLNASGVALPRTIAALLETRQQPDGSVTVPAALVPYLGMERLVPPPPSAGGP